MTQNFIIFAIIELIILGLLIYLIIKVNKYVNTLQKEVNELYLYVPAAIRNIKNDLVDLNDYISKKSSKLSLSQHEAGFIAGKIFTELILTRFSPNPFKRKMLIASVFWKLWSLRERLKVTFVKCFVR